MAKAYIARCIVKKDGKTYQKGDLIEGLTGEEIKQGLARHWFEEVGGSDEPAAAENGGPEAGGGDEPVEEKDGRPGGVKKNRKGADREALFDRDAGAKGRE